MGSPDVPGRYSHLLYTHTSPSIASCWHNATANPTHPSPLVPASPCPPSHTRTRCFHLSTSPPCSHHHPAQISPQQMHLRHNAAAVQVTTITTKILSSAHSWHASLRVSWHGNDLERQQLGQSHFLCAAIWP